ncbi:hypothetical protein OH491_13220 [Termitidicoccus mucosus]|uniref:Glycosyltransferase RgtA/B/C/D-like domain-containing protein n=1 Tax=Termitidicoccus mucosus TaxID=1184151 RepID=A0A178IJ49_9BACT|nr:hypothetical protein AW736_14235 [Opitutaceae bacterium TSB47]
MSARSLQEWVHWLEVGDGTLWLRRAAFVAGVLILSGLVGYKQFRGPASEETLAQAAMARQLAEGRGFSTPVNYPQTAAWARERFEPGAEAALPELHHAPLYPLVIAGALKVFPAETRAGLFGRAPEPPNGFRADYVLLALNVLLLWCAAWQTWRLARRWFDAPTAWVAMGAMLVSAPVWQATVAVNGAPLAMVLLLALFQIEAAADRVARASRPCFAGQSLENMGGSPMPHNPTGGTPVPPDPRRRDARAASVLPAAGAGVVCGLLFLTDYAALAVLPVALAGAWRRRAGARTAAVLLAAFAVVAGPWVGRNIALTGNPLAFAWQGVALKAGDPTAEPATVRATFSPDAPRIDVAKLGNKVLTSLQRGLGVEAWSGGGLLLTAFFVAGCLYRFRRGEANGARWLFVAALGAWVVARAFLDSGEGERSPWVCAAPVMAVFGARFFTVLVASHATLGAHAARAAWVLLAVQALPLARELAEPRKLHFSYPPYYPALFQGVARQVESESVAAAMSGREAGWMCDVPAGAAWYGGGAAGGAGGRVWAQPATVRDFLEVNALQPQAALVLTPHTLARPFFAELAKGGETAAAGETAAWAQVYRGLATGRVPPGFPLSRAARVADDLHILINPALMPPPAPAQR